MGSQQTITLFQFLTFFVAWCSPVVASLVAWHQFGRRSDERALLNVVSVRPNAGGGVVIDVENDGTRPAMNLVIDARTGRRAFRDGLRGGQKASMILIDQPVEAFSFTLDFSDTDGARYTEQREVSVVDGTLSVDPRSSLPSRSREIR